MRDNDLPRDYVVKKSDTLGTVTKDEIIVRDEPNADSAPVSVLYQNNKVYINGEDGDWYKVSFTQTSEALPFDGYVLKTDITV